MFIWTCVKSLVRKVQSSTTLVMSESTVAFKDKVTHRNVAHKLKKKRTPGFLYAHKH